MNYFVCAINYTDVDDGVHALFLLRCTSVERDEVVLHDTGMNSDRDGQFVLHKSTISYVLSFILRYTN